MAGTRSNEKQSRHIIRKILLGIVIVVAAILIGFNAYIRMNYMAFFSEARSEFPVPDSNSGFVVQDLDHVDTADMWLFSGYMHKSDIAPVIRRDSAGTISKIYVKLLDGTLYGMHHGSGITSTDEYTFLTTDTGYVVMRTDDVVNAADGETVDVIAERELGLGPAFLSISDGVLYTGEFYYPDAYETPDAHRLTAPDGELNPAIMYAFDADPDGFYGFSEVPDRIYSIPDKVQGVCVTDDNKMVLSCSWGINGSHLLVYDMNKIVEEGTFMLSTVDEQGAPLLATKTEGASLPSDRAIPLFYLDSSSKIDDILAPPMSEGITVYGGRVYIPNESASNKYIFGKLYPGGDMIYSLEI